jgi:hypothetical protein
MPVIYEIARSHESPDIFSLPEDVDVTVEVFSEASFLRLEGKRSDVHVHRFDHVIFP